MFARSFNDDIRTIVSIMCSLLFCSAVCGRIYSTYSYPYYGNLNFSYSPTSGCGGLFTGSAGSEGGLLVDSLESTGGLSVLVDPSELGKGTFVVFAGSAEDVLVGSTRLGGGLFAGSTPASAGVFEGSTGVFEGSRGLPGGLWGGSPESRLPSFPIFLKSAEYNVL